MYFNDTVMNIIHCLYNCIPTRYKMLRKRIAKLMVKYGKLEYIRKNVRKKGYSKCPICRKGYFKPKNISDSGEILSSCKCSYCSACFNICKRI